MGCVRTGQQGPASRGSLELERVELGAEGSCLIDRWETPGNDLKQVHTQEYSYVQWNENACGFEFVL
jgi:hypothetical protein